MRSQTEVQYRYCRTANFRKFPQIREKFLHANITKPKIRENFMHMNCLCLKFAKISCRENFLFYSTFSPLNLLALEFYIPPFPPPAFIIDYYRT